MLYYNFDKEPQNPTLTVKAPILHPKHLEPLNPEAIRAQGLYGFTPPEV